MPSNKDPLASIIIRTKNRPEFLGRAIESALGQTYSNVEIVIVNDGGADVSNIIKHYRNQFEKKDIDIEYVVNKRSFGRPAAANLGIETSTGSFISFLDDDDYHMSHHIERHVRAQEKSKNLVSVSRSMESIEKRSNGAFIETEKRYHFPEKINRLAFYFFENYFPFNTLVFQRKVLEKVGGFDMTLDVLEDWDFMTRLFLDFEPVHIDDVTTIFTTRTGDSNVRMSLSSKKTWEECFMKVTNKHKQIYQEHKELIVPISEAAPFLAEHAKEWYKTTKELEALRGSVAYKIFHSPLYDLLKKVGKKFHLTRG